MSAVGRISNQFSSQIRDQIRNGKMGSTGYLPPIRELSKEHGLAMRTVQRALGALEKEGLIVAEPRRGYRVLARSHDPNCGMPLAFLLSTAIQPSQWEAFEALLSRSFQKAAVLRGWSMLAVSTSGRRVEDVIEQLRAANACGAILDTLDPELISLAKHLGLPVVMVDAWVEKTDIDAVLQDNYRGGYLAAEYLVQKGHRDVAWFGPIAESPHGRERFGGAAAYLASAGHTFTKDRIYDTQQGTMEREAAALFARSKHPRAILTLYRDVAVAVAKAARARGLVVGRDVELVGWCVEEMYQEMFKAVLPEGQVPPAIVWSMAEMAESALRRVVDRRTAPGLPMLRMHVPVRLVVP